MAPTIALAALMILFAFSEYIASKTRATISSVLALAVLMLAGFWTEYCQKIFLKRQALKLLVR